MQTVSTNGRASYSLPSCDSRYLFISDGSGGFKVFQIILPHTPPTPPPKTPFEMLQFIMKIVGSVVSAASTCFGLYLKKGLIKSIIFKNQYTKADELTSYDQADNYEHTFKNRHGEEIQPESIKLVSTLRKVKEHVRGESILPNYFVDASRHKPLASGMALPAWLEYSENKLTIDKGELRKEDMNQQFTIQTIAHDGEI